jgi:4-hydroxy-4-methyl-2-oxoglutarate aldolase
MIGQIGFGFIEEIAREDPNLIKALYGVGSADVTDAQNRTGAMDSRIRTLSADRKILGSALTVNLPPGDNLMLYKAMQLAQPGDVLVVNTNGNSTKAIWGELMTKSAMALKISGLVVDGLIRDGGVISQLDFPVFCCGTVPVSVEKSGPGFVNGEIVCGGTVVHPGDIIVGDDDGVVVIAKQMLSMVVENIKKLQEREVLRRQEIENGQILPKWLDRVMIEKGLVPGNQKERFLE